MTRPNGQLTRILTATAACFAIFVLGCESSQETPLPAEEAQDDSPAEAAETTPETIDPATEVDEPTETTEPAEPTAEPPEEEAQPAAEDSSEAKTEEERLAEEISELETQNARQIERLSQDEDNGESSTEETERTVEVDPEVEGMSLEDIAKSGVIPLKERQSEEDADKAFEEEMKRRRAERMEKRKKVIESLGKPLVDNFEDMRKLDPVSPVWLDKKNKRVVVLGQVCQTKTPLEFLACLVDTKEHEAILSFDTKAFLVHAGLLATGAKAGTPVQFRPTYVPAKGTVIEITLKWKDEQGEVKSCPAQQWILNTKVNKPMQQDWVFAGSGFYVNESTGQRTYKAEGGDFICVSNFPSAMLDLPVESTQADAQLLYETNTEMIPPKGTPVTMILSPKGEEGAGEKSE